MRERLNGRRPWVWAGVLALLVLAPSYGSGLLADDHLLRANLLRDPRVPELGTAWWDGFHFLPEAASGARGIQLGYAPWWAAADARARLLRPLASATHALDFALWPASGLAMHLQNALWYAALCALAAVAYRRWLDGWAAGLAALFFAIDFTHGMAAGWVANRNALMAAVFGLAGVLVHTAAKGWRGRLLGAVLLGLGLCCGEAGLGAFGLLLAWALTLEPGSPVERLRSLVPAGLVGLAWAAVEVLGGFGVRGSGMYLDPRADPAAFFTWLPVNAALQLASELGGAGPDLWPVLSRAGRLGLVVAAVAVLGLATTALWPLLRREPRARFFAWGSVLAVIPYCATFPSSRLMLIPGLGLVALCARAVASWRDGAAVTRPQRLFAGLVTATHLLLAVPLLFLLQGSTANVQRVVRALLDGVPDEPALEQQQVLVANLPDQLFMLYLRPTAATEQRALPRGLYPLAMGLHPLELTRVDERTLRISDPAGFFGDGFTLLTRPRGLAVQVGQHFVSPVADVEVVAVSDGVPTQVTFHLADSLDSPRTRLVQWNGATLVPLSLADGATVALPALAHPLLPRGLTGRGGHAR